jgi:hypothetical protein
MSAAHAARPDGASTAAGTRRTAPTSVSTRRGSAPRSGRLRNLKPWESTGDGRWVKLARTVGSRPSRSAGSGMDRRLRPASRHRAPQPPDRPARARRRRHPTSASCPARKVRKSREPHECWAVLVPYGPCTETNSKNGSESAQHSSALREQERLSIHAPCRREGRTLPEGLPGCAFRLTTPDGHCRTLPARLSRPRHPATALPAL